jgi:BirA family transcriptional regulator, biotin operon repressor / biotin---[acetyl-CoA-carboxylase] ligase
MIEVLGADSIRAALSCQGAAMLDVEVLEQIDSTNAEANRRIAAGRQKALALFAINQTAGRGRDGKPWITRPGESLCFSLIWPFTTSPKSPALLSLASALSLAQALRSIGARVQIKWPNDLQIEGKKLAGILLESSQINSCFYLVIGVGLNLSIDESLRAQIDQPITGLHNELEAPLSVNQLAAKLLDALTTFLHGVVVHPVDLSQWPKFDALYNQTVRVVVADELIDGRAVGIASDGSLRVQTQLGERQFQSAMVSVRKA